MTEVLPLTHLVCFLLGGLFVYRYFPRAVERALDQADDHADPDGGTPVEPEQEQPESETPQGGDSAFSIKLIAVVLIAAVFVIIIGAQAYLDGRDRDRAAVRDRARDKQDRIQQVCQQRWADKLTRTIQARTEVNARLRAAETEKDAADDAITDLFVVAVSPNPPADADLLKKFQKALADYVKARDHLAEVRADVSTTSVLHPYPTLKLDCKYGQKQVEAEG